MGQDTVFLNSLHQRLYGAHELVGVHPQSQEGVPAGLYSRQLSYIGILVGCGKGSSSLVQHFLQVPVMLPVVQALGRYYANAVVRQLFKHGLINNKSFHLKPPRFHLSSQAQAARAAAEPSATAVVSWRTPFLRQSPATKIPVLLVRQSSPEAA